MAVAHGRYWHIGMDRRRVQGQPYRAWILNDYTPPAGQPLNKFPSSLNGPTGSVLVPYCLSAAPFATDSLGQSFPAGTVWVVAGSIGDSSASRVNIRTPPNTNNPLNATSNISFPGCALDYTYNANGIPSGATAHVTVVGSTSGTSYATFDVIPNGTAFQYDVPAFTPSTNDTSLAITCRWTGGTPACEGFTLHPLCQAACNAVAVPSTLPAGYTLRLSSDIYRGASFAKRNGGDPRRLLSGPYATYATMGLAGSGGGDPMFDLGVPGQDGSGIWVNGLLYTQGGWVPQAVGRTTFSAQASYIAGQTGTSSSFSSFGVRYCQVSFTYQKFVSDPGSSDTFTWTVTQDGTTVGSGTVTGAAIMSIPTQTVTTTLPAINTNTTIQISCSGSGGTSGFGQPDWECSATVAGSPRCDIPLAFTCVGPGNIAAPGGYVPSLLTFPTNHQPLTTTTQGTTTIAFGGSPGNGMFVPASDGWWQVLISGTPQKYIGEDEFGWQDVRTVRRGRIGRPFYCRADGGGTATLTRFTPPSPTTLTASPTALTQGSDTWAVWCSATFPTKALYRVTFTMASANIAHGLVVDTSATDPQVINPDHTYTWEPFSELGPISWQNAILSTPPNAPGSYQGWIVGANPTGAWAGHANAIAVWDDDEGQWIFRAPTAGSYINGTYWFDGSAWHSNGTDPQLTILVNATAGQVMYFCAQPMSTEAGGASTITAAMVTP